MATDWEGILRALAAGGAGLSSHYLRTQERKREDEFRAAEQARQLENMMTLGDQRYQQQVNLADIQHGYNKEMDELMGLREAARDERQADIRMDELNTRIDADERFLGMRHLNAMERDELIHNYNMAAQGFRQAHDINLRDIDLRNAESVERLRHSLKPKFKYTAPDGTEYQLTADEYGKRIQADWIVKGMKEGAGRGVKPPISDVRDESGQLLDDGRRRKLIRTQAEAMGMPWKKMNREDPGLESRIVEAEAALFSLVPGMTTQEARNEVMSFFDKRKSGFMSLGSEWYFKEEEFAENLKARHAALVAAGELVPAPKKTLPAGVPQNAELQTLSDGDYYTWFDEEGNPRKHKVLEGE